MKLDTAIIRFMIQASEVSCTTRVLIPRRTLKLILLLHEGLWHRSLSNVLKAFSRLKNAELCANAVRQTGAPGRRKFCHGFGDANQVFVDAGLHGADVNVIWLFPRRLRLIYTSDFRGRFRIKLVPFTEYNYFLYLGKCASLMRNRTLV
jgi:hypothetical protein